MPEPKSLLEPSFAEPYNAWKANPHPESTGNLLRSVDPIINEAMRTYGSGSSASPTLRGKAKQLALSAIETYDPNRAKLRTHLLTQLQGLRRYAGREEQIVKIPEQASFDLNRLRRGEMELKDSLGREPSDAEVADHTSLSTRRIKHLRTVRPSYAMSSIGRSQASKDSPGMPAIVSTPGTKSVQAWHEFIYHDMDPVDQVIMEYTFGMHGKRPLPNQDIAKKLRLSPGAISQRKVKIQEKLDLSPVTGLFS